MKGLVHLFVAFQPFRNNPTTSPNDGHVQLSTPTTFQVSSSLFPFPFPPKSTPSSPSSSASQFSSSRQQAELDRKLDDLMDAISEAGPVGSLASKEDQQRIQTLSESLKPYSIRNPANFPLKGEFKLLYSSTSGSSSGRFFGTPIFGKVKQVILDDDIFQNSVQLGPLEMTVKAKRQIMNHHELKITLLEGAVSLFHIPLLQKDIINTGDRNSSNGGSSNDKRIGSWKYIFLGTRTTTTTTKKGQDGKKQRKLIRIMQAPNLFILEQDL